MKRAWLVALALCVVAGCGWWRADPPTPQEQAGAEMRDEALAIIEDLGDVVTMREEVFLPKCTNSGSGPYGPYWLGEIDVSEGTSLDAVIAALDVGARSRGYRSVTPEFDRLLQLERPYDNEIIITFTAGESTSDSDLTLDAYQDPWPQC